MSKNTYTIQVDNQILTKLLRGGLVLPHDKQCGLVVLIRGKAGTGKSTFALQLLDIIVSDAPRYYCTLEQTKEDLTSKLAAMIVAQGIQQAFIPNYKDNTFHCDMDTFIEYLKTRFTLRQKFEDEINDHINKIGLPLYKEPEEKAKTLNAKSQEDLADSVLCNLVSQRINIIDCNVDKEHHAEGPFTAFRSRVVLASQMLNVITQPEKAGKPPRNELPVVVVDGLSLLSSTERETLELQRIVEYMRRTFQLGILVYEPNKDESTGLDHHADLVIELTRHNIERPLHYLIHELCIVKARYQEAALGRHQFKIRGSGIAIFPSLHFQAHHHNYMDLEFKRSTDSKRKPTEEEGKPSPCNEGSLIDLICNPQPSESTVLLGPRNSFKSQLCLDFLSRGNWGCPDKHKEKRSKGLLVSLIDNAPDIQQRMVCPWRNSLWNADKTCSICTQSTLAHVRSFCQRPGFDNPFGVLSLSEGEDNIFLRADQTTCFLGFDTDGLSISTL